MKRMIALIVVLLAAGKLAAPPPAAARMIDPVVLPAQMCRGYFFLPVTPEVRDDETAEDRTLWFLYDTGASASYVDPDSIERVSGQRLGSGIWANFGRVTTGPLALTGLRAGVRELDHLSVALGREIDGILEYDAFEDVLLTLDYGLNEMRVESGALPRPDGVTVFDADGPDFRPWIRVRFPDRTRRLLIDSGAALSPVVLRNLERYDTVAPPRATGSAVRFEEIERRSSARLAGNARIGRNELIQPVIQSTPGTELLGGQAMRHFVWTFDQRHERVRIVRHDPETPITFEPLITHGLVLVPEGDGMRVATVIANSPAFDAGIQTGDFITHFNGRTMRDRDCSLEITQLETLDLSLMRHGETLDVRLTLYPLVD